MEKSKVVVKAVLGAKGGVAQKQESVSDTVLQMQRHFASTRTFRATDLMRVLGDPTEGVSVTLPHVVRMNAR